jgi:Holliday junction resolvase
MTTPEKKVKDKIKKLLEEYGAYYFMPTTGGYGRSGVPDIVACLRGKFIGIECKANGNKPTALQEKNLMEIMNVGGFAVAVDENGIELFKNLLNQIKQSDKIPREAGILFDLLTTKELK